jgi:pimeloyl-ACP methyl ester carboxylesterase
MVNFVQVLRNHFVDRLGKSAGLRQHAMAVDDAGTIINFWVPKQKKAPEEKRKHAVVLVHGFAGDGMMTWGFQVGALAKHGYDVYVPDLVHFGGSSSPSADRSLAFQARCIAAGLRKLGVVERCTVVGFSYGGLVAFEMAAVFPGLVRSIVVSGAVVTYTASINDALLARFGAGSMTELMLPETLRGVTRLLTTAFYKKPWLPRRLLKDFQKVSTCMCIRDIQEAIANIFSI